MSHIVFNKETDRRIEYNRLAIEGEKPMSENNFRHWIFMLGLLHYEEKVVPKKTGKPYVPYYFIKGEDVFCKADALPKQEAV
jgi:hypothetical protein